MVDNDVAHGIRFEAGEDSRGGKSRRIVVDTGIEFDTHLYGDYRAVYFQIPLFWVRGSGSLEDRALDERWVVRPR